MAFQFESEASATYMYAVFSRAGNLIFVQLSPMSPTMLRVVHMLYFGVGDEAEMQSGSSHVSLDCCYILIALMSSLMWVSFLVIHVDVDDYKPVNIF